MPSDMEIDVTEVKKMLDSKKKFKLIDVREPFECEICKIDGTVLIPLGTIQEKRLENLNGLEKNDEIILHCKAGVRSMKAAIVLKELGFKNIKSMKGGILEWSERIDPTVQKY